MINKKLFLGDLIQVMFHHSLASSVSVKDGTLTSMAVTGASQKISWEQLVTCLAHSKEYFKTSLAAYRGSSYLSDYRGSTAKLVVKVG